MALSSSWCARRVCDSPCEASARRRHSPAPRRLSPPALNFRDRRRRCASLLRVHRDLRADYFACFGHWILLMHAMCLQLTASVRDYHAGFARDALLDAFFAHDHLHQYCVSECVNDCVEEAHARHRRGVPAKRIASRLRRRWTERSTAR